MKWQAVLILLAISLSILLPPALPFMTDPGRETVLGELDVCHSAMPAVSSHGDMPCMNECPCSLPPLTQSSAPDIKITPLQPFLFVSRDDRPPKV